MNPPFTVEGFLSAPKRTAQGKIYRGRFTCNNVQWTGEGSNLLATFTITAEELADAAENRLLWTDQDVQRGIRPDINPPPARELCLADGYPNTSQYIFDTRNADDIAEKLLFGEKLFLSPLVWNLRPGTFEAYWDDAENAFYIYNGKFYLPDSHHRQQAIAKAVRAYRGAKRDYPRFSGDHQFKIELYFLSREDEGNYFFDKNQRPKPTAKSKAYDLTTADDLSRLAKLVIEKSQSLQENVNRVTDRLTQRNPQVITLSTLREMMRSFAPSDQLDPSELEGLALVAAQFYDMLAAVRPELGRQSAVDRRRIRERLVVDTAVMMNGYAAVMKDFNDDLAKMGMSKAVAEWRKRLELLSSAKRYEFQKWRGDFFEKRNPLWRSIGIVKPGRDGVKLTVLNTGATRSECGRVLRQLLRSSPSTQDLRFLAAR